MNACRLSLGRGKTQVCFLFACSLFQSQQVTMHPAGQHVHMQHGSGSSCSRTNIGLDWISPRLSGAASYPHTFLFAAMRCANPAIPRADSSLGTSMYAMADCLTGRSRRCYRAWPSVPWLGRNMESYQCGSSADARILSSLPVTVASTAQLRAMVCPPGPCLLLMIARHKLSFP